MVGHVILVLIISSLLIMVALDLWRSHFRMRFTMNPESVRMHHTVTSPLNSQSVVDAESRVNARVEQLHAIKRDTDRRQRTPSRVIPGGLIPGSMAPVHAAPPPPPIVPSQVDRRKSTDPLSDTAIMAVDAKIEEIKRLQSKK